MPKTWIQLGKTGDLCNLLPLLFMESQRGPAPQLMVAREFAPLLEGVTYVRPQIYDGPYHELDQACILAQRIDGDWLATQVNGPADVLKSRVYGPAGLEQAVTTSFTKESWRVAGKLSDWDDQPALLFDRRNAAREKALIERWMPAKFKGKHILLCATGASSPFPYAQILRELVKAKYPNPAKWNIIDLAQVKAERFYDLLALYERAWCLISTDTAPLHLARAMPNLPVLALANDRPLLWNGSAWRPNHVWYCRYHDFPERVGSFVGALDTLDGPGSKAGEQPGIVHVWNEYAGATRWGDWFDEYQSGAWVMCPVPVGGCGRDTVTNLKDEQRHPYLRDCLRMGLQKARADDWVCLTRPETRFRPGLTQILQAHDRTFAYRMGVRDGIERWQPVADLLCAKKSWWKSKLSEIPDLVWGRDQFWPHVLWALFNADGAHDATGAVYRIES